MKLPSVPWKNIWAIGGAVRIKVIGIKPIPTCCMAWLFMPSLIAPIGRKLLISVNVQNAAATRITMSKAIDTNAARTAIENMVPMPYDSHFWNNFLL